MISFKEYLQSNKIAFSAFLISRSNMPQIKDPNDFSEFLYSVSVKHEFRVVCPKGFQATQTDKDDSKIKRLMGIIQDKPEEFNKYAPVVVSSDGFVLDGHHRYFACLYSDVNMNALVVDLTINQLLKIANEYKEFQSG